MTKHPHSMTSPPPTYTHTPHTHNYNTIRNFVDLKIGVEPVPSNKSSSCLKPPCNAFAEAQTLNSSSSPISHHAPQYNQLGIKPYHAKMRLRDF